MTQIRSLLVVGVLAGLLPAGAAGADPAAARVSDATLKAWRKLGAEVIWLDQGRAPDVRPGRQIYGEPEPGDLVTPLFDLPGNLALAEADFPTPEGPFGLRLNPRQLADPALRRVREMKTLTTVHLKRDAGQFTRETIAVLREVGGLADLLVPNFLDPDPAVLADLGTLAGLRALSVRCPVRDETIAAWGRLKGLAALELLEGRGFEGTGLKALTKLRYLSLHLANVTDKGLLALAKLKELRALNLSFAYGGTDKGLEGLADLEHLTWLNLYDTNFGDTGLKHLPKQLTWLNLRNARGVTDAGMPTVAGLAKLEYLNVSQTRVTAAGLAVVRKAIPNCMIEAPRR
jgi:hypothetical protein